MSEAPTFEEFLEWDHKKVAEIVPKTVLLTQGGTRRHAVTAGVDPGSHEFFTFARDTTLSVIQLLLSYGVQDVFIPALTPSNLQEPGRQAFYQCWFHDFVLGSASVQQANKNGWQARILSDLEWIEPIAKAAAALYDDGNTQKRVWYTAISSSDVFWEWITRTSKSVEEPTRAAIAKAVLGKDVHSAQLWLSFGKPMLDGVIVPPFLLDGQKLHAYWRQQPGFSLGDVEWRAILYDAVFLRDTWHEDKTARAHSLDPSTVAEFQGVLGLGEKVGSFWQPASLVPPWYPVG